MTNFIADCLVHKMSENSGKHPFPDVLYDKNLRKSANCHTGEAGTRECLVVLLINLHINLKICRLYIFCHSTY